jgi:hypothetical protein
VLDWGGVFFFFFLLAYYTRGVPSLHFGANQMVFMQKNLVDI